MAVGAWICKHQVESCVVLNIERLFVPGALGPIFDRDLTRSLENGNNQFSAGRLIVRQNFLAFERRPFLKPIAQGQPLYTTIVVISKIGDKSIALPDRANHQRRPLFCGTANTWEKA